MISAVQVGASSMVQQLVQITPEMDEQVTRRISYFLTEDTTDCYAILKLCKEVSSIIGPSVVASYIVNAPLLFLWLDAVPEEIQKKYFYIPHSPRKH